MRVTELIGWFAHYESSLIKMLEIRIGSNKDDNFKYIMIYYHKIPRSFGATSSAERQIMI